MGKKKNGNGALLVDGKKKIVCIDRECFDIERRNDTNKGCRMSN